MTEEIKHNCTNCAERHNLCGHDYASDCCPYFVIGKCFICKHRGTYNDSICFAEDMSGYNCPNFVRGEQK